MYDLAILGGGPAGVAAGVYASRKQLKTIFITETFGGQSIVSDSIENWIGTTSLSGAKLAQDLEDHLRAYAEDFVDIKTGERAENVEKIEGGFKVKTAAGEYEAKTVLVATGSHRRKLDVPGAAEFENKGITYCASCDGPIFKDKDVVVIGGGNAGFEAAAQLLAYCKSVTLLHRGAEFKADPVTVEAVLKDPKMTAIKNANTKEVRGSNFVESLVYEDLESGEQHEIEAQGIFVEIGAVPSTSYVADLVETTKYGQISVDCKNQRASIEGIWAAGDCTDGLYHQNNIAAGDGVKALEDIYVYLKAR